MAFFVINPSRYIKCLIGFDSYKNKNVFLNKTIYFKI